VNAREKKMAKMLGVLGPVFLLALWYGYSTIQETRARRAARIKRAQEKQEQAANQPATPQPPAAGASAQAAPAKRPAPQAQQAPATASFSGIYITADNQAQEQRMTLPWGRDPFVPPDTRGPLVTVPKKIEAPRDERVITLKIPCTDQTHGNSGVLSARLYFGSAPPFDDEFVDGIRPQSDEKGDGDWTFTLPAPKDQPIGGYVVAVDAGRLNSTTRSSVFMISPPPPDVVQVSEGGTQLVLRGVSWSGDSGVALINNDVVGVGEYVAGYEIIKIVKNGVMLKRGKNDVFLQLKE
jgi:hypothetical protein